MQKKSGNFEKVGLEKMMSRRPSELSGGQHRRVARAIAAEPKIVLANEPTANLEGANSQQLISLMKQLNKHET